MSEATEGTVRSELDRLNKRLENLASQLTQEERTDLKSKSDGPMSEVQHAASEQNWERAAELLRQVDAFLSKVANSAQTPALIERLKAASELAREGAHEEALEKLETLLADTIRLGQDAIEAAVRGSLAQPLVMTGRKEEALEQLDLAEAIARRLDQPEALESFEEIRKAVVSGSSSMATSDDPRYQALQAAHQLLATDKRAEGLESLRNLLAETRKKGDSAMEASVCEGLAIPLAEDGLQEEALALLDRAIAIAEEVEQAEARAHFEGLKRIVASGAVRESYHPQAQDMQERFERALEDAQSGKHSAAIEQLEDILKTSKTNNFPNARAAASRLLAELYALQGRQEEARASAEDARKTFELLDSEEGIQSIDQLLATLEGEDSDDTSMASAVLHGRIQEGMAALDEGREQQGFDILQEVLDASRDLSDLGLEASAAGMLSQLHLMRGQREKALELAERALEIARASGDGEAINHFGMLADAARDVN